MKAIQEKHKTKKNKTKKRNSKKLIYFANKYKKTGVSMKKKPTEDIKI